MNFNAIFNEWNYINQKEINYMIKREIKKSMRHWVEKRTWN